jgi:hypothetical protein
VLWCIVAGTYPVPSMNHWPNLCSSRWAHWQRYPKSIIFLNYTVRTAEENCPSYNPGDVRVPFAPSVTLSISCPFGQGNRLLSTRGTLSFSVVSYPQWVLTVVQSGPSKVWRETARRILLIICSGSSIACGSFDTFQSSFPPFCPSHNQKLSLVASRVFHGKLTGSPGDSRLRASRDD